MALGIILSNPNFAVVSITKVQAVSAEIVDDEPLPNSGTSSTGGCVGDVTFGDLDIARPMPITLAGYVLDVQGNHTGHQ